MSRFRIYTSLGSFMRHFLHRENVQSAITRKQHTVSSFMVKELIAAPFTPFLENGDVNYSVIDRYADYMVSTNFTGLFINGTISEGMSLTLEERKNLAEAWEKASDGRLETIVQVGANCIKDSQELACHAEQIGSTAISAITPTYYKPENEDVLVDVMAEIAMAAPNTPFYYYDFNTFTGVYMNQKRFAEKAKKRIPTFRGLKNSSPDLPNAHDCSRVEHCQMLTGTVSQYLCSLALGIPGVITAAYFGVLFSDMRQAFESNDLQKAQEIQIIAQDVNNIVAKYGGGLNLTKYVSKILVPEIDVGHVRLPLRRMTSAEFKGMKNDFISAGLQNVARPRP